MSDELAQGSLAVLDLLENKKVRELDDVVDIASTISAAILRGHLSNSTARELRQWTELMYTCVQAKNISTGDGDVNFITQLVQMSAEPRQIIETKVKEEEDGSLLIDIEALTG